MLHKRVRQFFVVLGSFFQVTTGFAGELAKCDAMYAGVNEPALPRVLAAEISPRLNFDTAGKVIEQSRLSDDGRQVAYVIHEGPGRNSVIIQDVGSSKTLGRAAYGEINSIQFVPGSRVLLVNARKSGADDRFRPYLVQFSNHPGAHIEGNLPALPIPTELAGLPESRFHGTKVEQVIARPDLPVLSVTQNSSNAIKSVRRANVNDGADPMTSLLNQNTSLIDAKTGKFLQGLSYEGLVPIHGALNPRSSIVAYWLVNPITAGPYREAIILVDLKDPSRILSRYDLPSQPLKAKAGPNVEVSVGNQVRFSWSSDGKELLAYEANSGTLVNFDLNTGKVAASARAASNAAPLEAAAILSSGQSLVIRSQELVNQGGSAQMKGYLLPPHGVDHETPAAFSLNLQLSQIQGAKSEIWTDTSAVGRGRKIYEMKGGTKWAVVFPHHVLVIDAKAPHDPSVLSITGNKAPRRSNKISSVTQISDDTLRVSDESEGVVDIKF